MILVVMGSNEAVAEEVVKEFMTLFPAQCRRLYANHFAESGQRSAYLARALTDAAYSSENVTLIPQVQTDGELNMLRIRGAYVMHVYGALSSAHSDIQIDRRDYIVKRPSRVKHCPGHVMSVDEVMSDLQYRRRKLRREAVA